MELKEYICDYCNETIIGRNALYRHKKTVHNITNGQQPKIEYECEFCGKRWTTTKAGFIQHIRSCKLNPNRIDVAGHPVSKETKKKISESMKIAHKEGRTSSWIGLRKRSYAEQNWFNIFEKYFGKENFKNNFPVSNGKSTYFLDFAWPEKMIYFEVDGRTHFTKEGIEHDKKRTEYLNNKGWTLIGRCNWSSYMSLSSEEKSKYISNVIDGIKSSEVVMNLPEKVIKISKGKLEGRLDKNGRPNSRVLLESEWEERKKLILESNIDLSKFGWVGKVEEKTGLSKRQIEKTIDHFFDFFTGKIYRRK